MQLDALWDPATNRHLYLLLHDTPSGSMAWLLDLDAPFEFSFVDAKFPALCCYQQSASGNVWLCGQKFLAFRICGPLPSCRNPHLDHHELGCRQPRTLFILKGHT